jgi:hypothetical protein
MLPKSVSRMTPVWFNKGKNYGDLGNHNEAINCYDKVLELSSSYHCIKL